MEGSEHRIRSFARSALAAALLGAAVAAAGCGGGGGDDSAQAPAPVTSASSGGGGVVTADATEGLVGPAARSTDGSEQFDDAGGKIPRNANRKTEGQKHGVAGGEACNDGGVTPTADNTAQVNAAILCLVNGERANNGLPALAQSSQLDQAAAGMAQRMVTEHFFSHETPDGKTVVDRVKPTGYIPNSGDWVVGENLAWGSGALSTPQAIVNGWMNSPGHRANILAADYKDIGLAAVMGSPTTSSSGGTVYVNNYGAKSGADPNIELPSKGTAASNDSGDAGDGSEPAVAGTTADSSDTSSSSKKAKAKKKKHKKKRRGKKRRRRHKRR